MLHENRTCCVFWNCFANVRRMLRAWAAGEPQALHLSVLCKVHSHSIAVATDVSCVQGMGTALQRIGQNPEGTVGNGVSNDDPDLVAYWTFDEGRGYVVHDVTKRGHDLYLTSEPHWEVISHPANTRKG